MLDLSQHAPLFKWKLHMRSHKYYFSDAHVFSCFFFFFFVPFLSWGKKKNKKRVLVYLGEFIKQGIYAVKGS